ncbi:MAG TPA: NifU family protein [Bacilli bacterium]|nr:NifU family protein [Bacilli bacterium]
MTIEEQIEQTLDKIRPFIRRDGGDVKFLRFDNGVVYVSMVGACQGCSLIDTTLTQGIEVILMEEVPGVLGVSLENDPSLY